MNFVAGFLSIGGLFALAVTTPDDAARSFEKALNAAPSVKVSANANSRYQPRASSVADLQLMLQRGDPDASIEMVASQLMAAHPSASVQQTGALFLSALEERRQRKSQEFAAKANAVLDRARTAILHAQTAADLDQVLVELNHVAGPQMQEYALGVESQELAGQLNLALQFVTAWQDYLSASSTGKTEQAREALERLLNNTQIDSLDYFPRSKLLALRDGAPTGLPGATGMPNSTESPADQADELLAKVKTVEDVSPTLTKIGLIPNQPMNLTGIVALEQARFDALAGLPLTLDLGAAMTNNYYGDYISHITALELLVILPYYFGTENSDPPKTDETLNDYLDRLAASADTAGNLALLQRVISTKVAVTRGHATVFGTPPAVFLAGLSQEAAGQYAPAVVTYEKSLQDFDPLEPIKIVGDRLAAIKSAHPDEFTHGMTTFLAPEPQRDSRFPLGMQPYPMRPGMALVSALPIPMTVSIPARTTTNAVPAAVSPPVTH